MAAVEKGGAPAWLFSFVDLAFLMLIAMTLLASQNAGAPDLGEMVVPRIGEKASKELAGGRGAVWQLRVHPPVFDEADELVPPFELLVTGTLLGPQVESQEGRGVRLDRDGLRAALAELKDRTGQKPLLAPHEDSRSQDLLDAASMIEELWPRQRRAVISRLMEPE